MSSASEMSALGLGGDSTFANVLAALGVPEAARRAPPPSPSGLSPELRTKYDALSAQLSALSDRFRDQTVQYQMQARALLEQLQSIGVGRSGAGSSGDASLLAPPPRRVGRVNVHLDVREVSSNGSALGVPDNAI
jgi:hypothetical protein